MAQVRVHTLVLAVLAVLRFHLLLSNRHNLDSAFDHGLLNALQYGDESLNTFDSSDDRFFSLWHSDSDYTGQRWSYALDKTHDGGASSAGKFDDA